MNHEEKSACVNLLSNHLNANTDLKNGILCSVPQIALIVATKPGDVEKNIRWVDCYLMFFSVTEIQVVWSITENLRPITTKNDSSSIRINHVFTFKLNFVEFKYRSSAMLDLNHLF